jgi:hypothetical protein
MMAELAAKLKAATGKKYNWRKRKIKYVFPNVQFRLFITIHSCLAHVINLATQALISAYSQSPHFDPKNPEAHVPTCHDEVGLVRAITVKVHANHIYSSTNTDCYCYSGAVIIETETNVENRSG